MLLDPPGKPNMIILGEVIRQHDRSQVLGLHEMLGRLQLIG